MSSGFVGNFGRDLTIPRVGIIGGTGFYNLPIDNPCELQFVNGSGEVAASSPVRLGELNGVPVAFIARHGLHHSFLPSEVPYLWNIMALRAAGCTKLISISAVGSLLEDLPPGKLCFPNQFIDRSVYRKNTFFGNGLVAHVHFSDPVCETMRNDLLDNCELAHTDVRNHTYVMMEGPAFSTRAESLLHKDQLGATVVGMTQATEAKLAREAELCYACISLVTDFDAWRIDASGVTNNDVLKVMKENAQKAEKLLSVALPQVYNSVCECGCNHTLSHSLVTPGDKTPNSIKHKLSHILKRYPEYIPS